VSYNLSLVDSWSRRPQLIKDLPVLILNVSYVLLSYHVFPLGQCLSCIVYVFTLNRKSLHGRVVDLSVGKKMRRTCVVESSLSNVKDILGWRSAWLDFCISWWLRKNFAFGYSIKLLKDFEVFFFDCLHFEVVNFTYCSFSIFTYWVVMRIQSCIDCRTHWLNTATKMFLVLMQHVIVTRTPFERGLPWHWDGGRFHYKYKFNNSHHHCCLHLPNYVVASPIWFVSVTLNCLSLSPCLQSSNYTHVDRGFDIHWHILFDWSCMITDNLV